LTKWSLWFALVVPTLVMLFIICPYNYYNALPALSQAHKFWIVCPAIISVSCRAKDTFPSKSKLLVIVYFCFVIGAVVNLFKVYAVVHHVGFLILKIILEALGGVLLITVCVKWVLCIYLKKLNLEEYWCTVHIIFGFVMTVAVVTMQLVFSSKSWAETGAGYYIAFNYIYIFFYEVVVLLTLDSQFMEVSLCWQE
jgi:hypothetical protein